MLYTYLDQKKLVQSFFRSASAQEQEPAFFSQLSRLDRVDPCWLIKAIIAYDFDSLPWLPDPFLSPSAQFDRRNFLAVLIKETEKHVKKSAQNIASASRDVIEEHETVLRLVVDDIIISLIRSTPAEQRLHLVDALVAYDDCYVAALARCLDCFEDPDLSTVIEHLAAAGQQSRVALLDAARIFDPATQAAIVMLVIESDPASISWALLDHVKTLGSSGQLLVLYQLVKLGQFDAIEELTWMIPVRDIRILRSLLENRPSCSLAKEIELPNIKSVDDEELARACRGVLEKRRGHARSSHESFDSTAKEKELRQFYRKHPSVLVALQKKSVRREILGTAELNLPTWLPAKSRTEWVETLRMHSYAAVELASNLTRIVPRKSDIPLFGPLAASGYPEEVLNILGRYPDIPPKALKHIHCAVAKGYIVAGRFEMADRFIAECSISEATFARYLETSAWKDFRVNNFDSLFALGAWARCRPSTDLSMQGFLTSQVYQKFVHPFFPNQQPQKSYNSPNEIFIRVGLPFLRERGFLLDASISFVSELASLFLQKNASTAAAWESHKANFGNWLLELQNVQEELTSILSFDRDYPKLQAPGLRNVIGLLSSSGLPLKNLSTDDVQARINILLENASAFKPDKFPGIEHIRMAFEALGDPSIDSDKRKRDREFLTGDLDPGSVNTYCSTLLHELLTTQQHIPLGYFDLELLTGLTGVGDIDVMKEKYAHLYLDLFAGKVAPTTSDIAGIPFDFTAERFSREAAQAFQFSGPSKALYQATRETLLNPKQFESPSALATRKSTLALVLQDAADDIHRKALSLPKAQGDKILYRSNLIKAAIESVAKAQSTSDLLYALCKYSDSDKQLKKHIREVALAVACDSAELKGHEIDALGSQEPSKESIERMYEILQDRVLHNSTVVDGIRDKMPALRAALGIGTLEEELRRLGKIGTRGVESIRAYATRGLLGELAGFIGESCLTRQENLMRRHPNATAIIFVKNADKPGSMRLEGSCFLVTVKDNDGNDVLVIRGLNPTQNLILSLNAASFFEEFLEQVVKPIARKLHIKKIAIPTPQKDIFFEARTNRPSLAVYLTDRCANLPSISFENDRDRAVFNDNSFEKSCVLLWSEPE